MPDHFDEQAKTWDDDPEKTARAADVARQIRERINVTTDVEVLDFGSGTGLLGFELMPHARSVTFADPSEGMLEQVAAKLQAGGHQGGQTLRVDPATLTLPQRYGAIVSLMTLHHVADPTAVMGLLADHLQPGGWLALCDLDTEDGTFHEDPHADVHHGFDRGTLVSQVTRMGLENVEVSTAFEMQVEGPEGARAYPLFLLTAQRPTSR